MNQLVKEINNLIGATQYAQSKGVYTLKQSAEIYESIQAITKIITPAPTVSNTGLSTISEKSENHK